MEDLFKAAHPESRILDTTPTSSPVGSLAPARTHSAQAAQDRAIPLDVTSINIEAILEWPTLRLPDQHQRPDLKTLLQSAPKPKPRVLLSSELDTSGALALLQLYLDHLHIYNPILKISDVEKDIKNAAFNGLGWDANSCLVVRFTPMRAFVPRAGAKK